MASKSLSSEESELRQRRRSAWKAIGLDDPSSTWVEPKLPKREGGGARAPESLTETATLRRNYVMELASFRPRAFASVRKHPKPFADSKWGVSPIMEKFVTAVQLDAQWFRIFVWKNAQRVRLDQSHACPDLALIPSPTRRVNVDRIPPPLTYVPHEPWDDFKRRARVHFIEARAAYGLDAVSGRNMQRQVSIAVRVIAGGWSFRRAAKHFGVKESSAHRTVEKFRTVLHITPSSRVR